MRGVVFAIQEKGSLRTTHKRCTKCRRLKPVEEFYKDSHLKSKRSPQCKKCHKQEHRLYYLEHHVAIHAQQKIYIGKNPEKKRKWAKRARLKKRKLLKDYFSRHPEKLAGFIRRRRKWFRDYYRDNHESLLASRRAYTKKNRRKLRAQQKRYRAKFRKKIRQKQ